MKFHGIEIGEIDYDFDATDPEDNPVVEGYDLLEKHLFLHVLVESDEVIKACALEMLVVNLLKTQEKLGVSLENIKWWAKPHPFYGPRLGWSAMAKKRET